MKAEIARHNLGNMKEIIFYDDKSAIIELSGTVPLHKISLSKEEVDRLEKVLKWR